MSKSKKRNKKNIFNKDTLRFDKKITPLNFSDKDFEHCLASWNKNTKVLSIEPLNGGFRNHNFKIVSSHDSRSVVLRVGKPFEKSLSKEMSILKYVSNKIKVPTVLHQSTFKNRQIAVLSYEEGYPLSHHYGEDASVFSDVGGTLAKIHQFKFDKAGFFDENLEFTEVFSGYGKASYDFTLSCLESELAKERMGNKLNQNILELMKDNKSTLENLEGATCLIHCDYNAKNILVDAKEVSAVLDWEFAASGSALVDIGNFLRFDEDYSSKEISEFISGYNQQGGVLPQNWEKISRLLDLASICDFITRKQKLPKTFATALELFKKTLRYL